MGGRCLGVAIVPIATDSIQEAAEEASEIGCNLVVRSWASQLMHRAAVGRD